MTRAHKSVAKLATAFTSDASILPLASHQLKSHDRARRMALHEGERKEA